MRTEQIRKRLENGLFATCPRYMESLVAIVNSGEIAQQETIIDVSPSHSYETFGNVAVVSVDGAMTKKNTWINAMCGGFTSYDILTEYINKAELNPAIDTILFNVDTAGGEVAGADEVGELIFNSSKKTVTYYNNLGASAGIWIFSASKEIYANQTAMIGSIGVMAGYRDAEDTSGSIKLVSKNAQNKDCSLNGDCKQKIQARIDEVETIFYSRVSRNTGLTSQEIAGKFAYGDVISSSKAVDAGFIKEITTFDQLLKSLTTATVPSASGVVKTVENNQGADMKFNRENLDEAEATFNALVANRDTLTSRSEKLEMQLETAKSALEAKTEEVDTLTAKLSEAEGKVVAESIVRMDEAIASGVSLEVAKAMISASSAEDASALVISSKESDGGTPQTEADAESAKAQTAIEYAKSYAKQISVS